jgi:hypothetical protein
LDTVLRVCAFAMVRQLIDRRYKMAWRLSYVKGVVNVSCYFTSNGDNQGQWQKIGAVLVALAKEDGIEATGFGGLCLRTDCIHAMVTRTVYCAS